MSEALTKSESKIQIEPLCEDLALKVDLEKTSTTGSLFERAISVEDTGPEFLIEEAEELVEDLIEEPIDGEGDGPEGIFTQELTADTGEDSDRDEGSRDELKIHEEE